MEWAISLIANICVNPFVSEPYRSENYWLTQVIAILILLNVGSYVFYFGTAGFAYHYLWVLNKEKYFPKTLEYDLEKQIAHEKWLASINIPIMAILMCPFTFGVSRGYSKIYYNVSDYGWPYFFFSIIAFFLFTDCLVYWIHRGLHLPWMYQNIHKIHHTYRYTTPFSSHAFHFVDGWSQGVTYYIFSYLMPFHHILFLVMFLFVNCWTVMIHDQVDFMSFSMVILSTGHHTIHHAQFNYNYGQYFTFWDRIMGTHLPAKQTNELLTGKKLK